ncbi:PHO85 cyclin family protein Ecym_4336 [Eremothecium cymbalariae DBVPG|uniref:Cyclin n=1 Tax=Eremothecium cymbalariae (strain CBS 270.75 / DBVPG 7215 / KCTC 17166 / NRRL Y-17582) TaxID=931890 RepID=G8JTP5_ERECY|nr:hypothetical protein Ecym_4336 [Eremothecium cymbalariae DBVPG\
MPFIDEGRSTTQPIIISRGDSNITDDTLRSVVSNGEARNGSILGDRTPIHGICHNSSGSLVYSESFTERGDIFQPSSFSDTGNSRYGSSELVTRLQSPPRKQQVQHGKQANLSISDSRKSPHMLLRPQRDSWLVGEKQNTSSQKPEKGLTDDITSQIESQDSPQVIEFVHPARREVYTDTKGEHMDIAKFPTDKLLEMLTSLLYKIIKSNDRLKSFEQEKHDINSKYVAHVLSFRGKHIPAITLGDYFARIQKYCPITNDVFLSLLVYFDRIAKRCNAMDPQLFVMDSYNIHRLIIAAVTVSTKFFSDFFYSNSRYARVGGISLHELNRLELQFSILCDFELIVSVQELQRYADLLYKFWNREHLNHSPATEPSTVESSSAAVSI